MVITGSNKIEGNIGSCKTEVTKIETANHFWYKDIQTIKTNNCTGVVETFDTWEMTPVSDIGIVTGIGIVLVAIVLIVSWVISALFE